MTVNAASSYCALLGRPTRRLRVPSVVVCKPIAFCPALLLSVVVAMVRRVVRWLEAVALVVLPRRVVPVV